MTRGETCYIVYISHDELNPLPWTEYETREEAEDCAESLLRAMECRGRRNPKAWVEEGEAEQ